MSGRTAISDEEGSSGIVDSATHVVCPSNTFSYHNQSRHQYYCYESPVKQIVATIETMRDASVFAAFRATSELHWYFSIRYSSLADPAAVAAQMAVKWTINDAAAQQYIDDDRVALRPFFADPGASSDDDEFPLQYSETQSILIPQSAFRDGDEYTVQVSYEVG